MSDVIEVQGADGESILSDGAHVAKLKHGGASPLRLRAFVAALEASKAG